MTYDKQAFLRLNGDRTVPSISRTRTHCEELPEDMVCHGKFCSIPACAELLVQRVWVFLRGLASRSVELEVVEHIISPTAAHHRGHELSCLWVSFTYIALVVWPGFFWTSWCWRGAQRTLFYCTSYGYCHSRIHIINSKALVCSRQAPDWMERLGSAGEESGPRGHMDAEACIPWTSGALLFRWDGRNRFL